MPKDSTNSFRSQRHGANSRKDPNYLSELRLLLEELCCDIFRFKHATEDDVPAEEVQIDREFCLGKPDAFADIRVCPRGLSSYFIEVGYGYTNDELVQSLHRKYADHTPEMSGTSLVIVLIDSQGRPNPEQIRMALQECIHPLLKMELWHEERLLRLLDKLFGIALPSITHGDLLDIRQRIDKAMGFVAFGGRALPEYDHDPLKAQLLWHFSFWRLRQIRESREVLARQILPPGLYSAVVVLAADLCGYSSYVRDTRDDGVSRRHLTSFYSKARFQIRNYGGMLYQFVGDEAIGFFGIPDKQPGYTDSAYCAARSLLSIGLSVCRSWQRHIDRVQPAQGLHIGMAIGDLQMVSLRPFSRTHMSAVGDAINLAARLMSVAGPSQIVISNAYHKELNEVAQSGFQEMEPFEAHNVGKIKAWRYTDSRNSQLISPH